MNNIINEETMGQRIKSRRKALKMTQEQLAEKADISRSHLSAIEVPNMVRGFSMDSFLNICDALDIDPAELINASMVPERILGDKSGK